MTDKPADNAILRYFQSLSPEQLSLLQYLIYIGDDETIVPLKVKREEVGRIKAVKLSESEIAKVQNFQEYLASRGYIKEPTFANLFVYLFNWAWTVHSQLAAQEAQKESDPS